MIYESKYPYWDLLTCGYCQKAENILVESYEQTRKLHFCSAECKQQHRVLAARRDKNKHLTDLEKYPHSPRLIVPEVHKEKTYAMWMPEYVRQLRINYGLPV